MSLNVERTIYQEKMKRRAYIIMEQNTASMVLLLVSEIHAPDYSWRVSKDNKEWILRKPVSKIDLDAVAWIKVDDSGGLTFCYKMNGDRDAWKSLFTLPMVIDSMHTARAAVVKFNDRLGCVYI
jgi:hypothetical protein